jgi:hypothetical protein
VGERRPLLVSRHRQQLIEREVFSVGGRQVMAHAELEGTEELLQTKRTQRENDGVSFCFDRGISLSSAG